MATVQEILDTPIAEPSFVLSPSRLKPLPSEITHSRPSAARVYDNVAGKYVSKGSDIHRVSYDPGTGEREGLLVEAEGRTNHVLASSNAQSGEWVQASTSLSAATSIIHGETAYEVVPNGSSDALQQTFGTFTGSDECLSVYLESALSDDISVGLYNNTQKDFIALGKWDGGETVTDNGSGIPRAEYLGVGPNGGNLIRIVIRAPSSDALNVSGEDRKLWVYPDRDTGTDSVIFHHAQYEEAPNATSPIVTGSSSVTRSADSYTIFEGGQPSWWNDQEMTLYTEILLPFFDITSNLNKYNHINSDNGYFLRNGSNNKLFAFSDGNIIEGPTDVTAPYTIHRYAISLTENQAIVSTDGQSVVNDYSGTLLGTTEMTLQGQSLFRVLQMTPKALSESTLNTLTS